MARLLLIDDDETTREVLSLLLTADGWQVNEAAGGDDAVRVSTALQPEVVLCDLHMPGLCGTALAAELRRSCGDAVVLLAMTATRLSAPPAGYDGLLVKPFSAAAVREATAGVSRFGSSDDAGEPALSQETFDGMKNAMPLQQLRALYDFALSDAERRVQSMQAATDDAALQAEAHALKGSCGMIGALRLRALAAAVEEGGLGEDSMRSKMFLEFSGELSAVRRMLEELFDSRHGLLGGD